MEHYNNNRQQLDNLTDDELRRGATRYNAIHNEGATDGYNPYEDEMGRRLDARLEAVEATFEIIWTADVTAARRVEWNAFASTLIATDAKGAWAKIAAKQDELGWTVADLKRAVALNNI